MIEGRIHAWESCVEKVKRLGESEEHDRVDYAESQHIARDHAVHHRDEWTGQSNSSVKITFI